MSLGACTLLRRLTGDILGGVTRSNLSARVREVLKDPTKRAVVFLIAMLVNLVIVFMNLLGAFDDAPPWAWGIVYAVYFLVLLPVLVIFIVLTVRESRERKARKNEGR